MEEKTTEENHKTSPSKILDHKTAITIRNYLYNHQNIEAILEMFSLMDMVGLKETRGLVSPIILDQFPI